MFLQQQLGTTLFIASLLHTVTQCAEDTSTVLLGGIDSKVTPQRCCLSCLLLREHIHGYLFLVFLRSLVPSANSPFEPFPTPDIGVSLLLSLRRRGLCILLSLAAGKNTFQVSRLHMLNTSS